MKQSKLPKETGKTRAGSRGRRCPSLAPAQGAQPAGAAAAQGRERTLAAPAAHGVMRTARPGDTVVVLQ